MPRTTKPARVRHDEILDAARRLFMTRGYARTPVQSVIDAVGIAKGTFYHHYRSKEALLGALVDRLREEGRESLRPVVEDPALGAVDKLNTLFARAGTWKSDRRELLVDLGRVLYDPANAGLLARLMGANLAATEPLVAQVVEQGVTEGAFSVSDPATAARIVARIGMSVSELLARRAVAGDRGAGVLAELRAACAAHDEALCRVLGARPGSLLLVSDDTLLPWFAPEAP